MPPNETPAVEVHRLRRTMRDLVALSTLPAVWAGHAADGIAQSLAEILLSTLSPDLVYVRVCGPSGADQVEIARGKGLTADAVQVRAVAEALVPWLKPGAIEPPPYIIDPITGMELRVAVARFGHTSDEGTVVVCSHRPDFPTEGDRLLLSVGANQVAVVLQRNRAERSLAAEREHLRITLASIGDAVISTDADGRVTFMNVVAESLTGWRQHEAMGQPLADIFHIIYENTRQEAENPALRALREGAMGLANHTVLISRDGKEQPIDDSAAPIRDARGGAVGAVLVFRDVTQRRQDELARARLSAIVDSSQDAIVSKSLDGIILSWNGGAEQLFGYTPAEAIGQPITLIIPPERQPEEREILERIRRGQRIEHFETVRKTKDGRQIIISLTVSPLRNSAGQVVGASKVARDITDRRRVEEQLREADRKKDEFIALLAHELRNPLAPIRNGLQVMRLADVDANPAMVEARSMMDRQLSHMVRLIDDLLDVSRINRSKMELRRARVALTDVVSAAVETARPAIDAEGHMLAVSLPQAPVFLEADLTRLAQVFSNLLTNSAKYTGRGGHIWLSAEQRGGNVAVAVRDTGIGIPADSLENIFDMFSQVDRSIERSTGGLGIGLALVKGLVEMHGGTVTAVSEGEGKGSEFTVILPVLNDRPGFMAAATSETVPVAGPGRRILVVDDNRDGAGSLAMMLRLIGNDVRTANDGVEAIAVAEQFRPELVLMDVGMPRLNGLDATRQIRERSWGRSITIIALTGWGQEGDRERSREAGCNGHLVKPVSLSDIKDLLRQLERKEG